MRGILFLAIALASHDAGAVGRRPSAMIHVAGDVAGTVTDSTAGQPLHTAEVAASRAGRIVARAITDNFGRYRIHDLPNGDYTLTVHLIGYRPVTRDLHLAGTGSPFGWFSVAGGRRSAQRSSAAIDQ